MITFEKINPNEKIINILQRKFCQKIYYKGKLKTIDKIELEGVIKILKINKLILIQYLNT